MSEHVVVETEAEGRVLRLAFNRPERRNALTQAMYAAACDALDRAAEDPAIRAVILHGEGEAFTAGNDLTDFARPADGEEPPVQRFLRTILSFEKPVIAAVNGVAVGIGVTMLLHCDLVFASETAAFRAPFAHVGVVPEAGSSLLLPQAVGMAMANDMLLGGRMLRADEALTAGLVSRVYPPEALLPEALETASDIAAQGPDAIRLSKRLIRSGREAIAAQMKAEGVHFAAQLASAEFAEATAAFMEKRKPNHG
ncbi:MAG: enoyl-CoA hydratase-related protein [Pseudomonadota bacterium]